MQFKQYFYLFIYLAFSFFFLKFFNDYFFFYFTILYWFCIHQHSSTTGVHPELPSHLTPHTIPLGHPSAPAPSFLYPVIEPWLVIHFLYDIIHVLMPFSQIIPPPSPTESKRLFYTSVSLLLSRIQGCRYHLSKFHIYALVNSTFKISDQFIN